MVSAVIQPSRGLSGHRLCAHLTVKPYAGVGCVSSTAAKYSSGATLRRYVGSPGASLTCSAPVGDILCSWFGTKRPQVQILSPRPVFPQVRGPHENWWGLVCCQYSSKIRPVQQRRRGLTCASEGAPPSLRRASRVAIGTSVRIDLQRHRHVCVTQVPHDHPRVDFLVHQQRCAGPPRVVCQGP